MPGTAGGGFHAQVNQIGTAGKTVAELSQEIRGLLSQIQSTVEGLGTGWVGADATQFASLSLEILQDCVPINQLLDMIGEHLGTTSTNYTADVQQNVGITGKLKQYVR